MVIGIDGYASSNITCPSDEQWVEKFTLGDLVKDVPDNRKDVPITINLFRIRADRNLTKVDCQIGLDRLIFPDSSNDKNGVSTERFYCWDKKSGEWDSYELERKEPTPRKSKKEEKKPATLKKKIDKKSKKHGKKAKKAKSESESESESEQEDQMDEEEEKKPFVIQRSNDSMTHVFEKKHQNTVQNSVQNSDQHAFAKNKLPSVDQNESILNKMQVQLEMFSDMITKQHKTIRSLIENTKN